MKSMHLGSSNTTKATSDSLSLISQVTGFEIVELWASFKGGPIQCVFVYATCKILLSYPHIVPGHYPERTTDEHSISLKLCAKVSNESNGMKVSSKPCCHWQTIADTVNMQELYPEHRTLIKTEMAYRLDVETSVLSIYIVGLSPRVIEFNEATVEFLFGLTYAVYSAAFDSEDEKQLMREESEEGERDEDGTSRGICGPDVQGELDTKTFVPSRPVIPTQTPATGTSAAELVSIAQECSRSRRVICGQSNSRSNGQRTCPYIGGNGNGGGGAFSETDTSSSSPCPEVMGSTSSFEPPPALPTPRENENRTTPNEIQESFAGQDILASVGTACESIQSVSRERRDDLVDPKETRADGAYSDSLEKHTAQHREGAAVAAAAGAPSWDPVSEYSYPVVNVPIKCDIPTNLTFDSFRHVQHLADGSNSNVYTGMYGGRKVVVKMLKPAAEGSPVAVHEFDVEYGMLARIDHSHIIKVLGAGQIPRRFIVLEYLGGGSLYTLLARHHVNHGQGGLEGQGAREGVGGVSRTLFNKPAFMYEQLLLNARDMAEALDYLHFRCHPGATIIHRDLKPDNIGFTSDGTLKLFDFGLVTCVKARKHAKDTYDMTGYTGSLRYMAPEVALRERYTEKVDVYSFGIMLWQMAKERMPFKGMNKEEFMRNVVRGGVRPKLLDKTWPAGFNDLLSRCWKCNPEERPSFAMVVDILNRLIDEHECSKKIAQKGSVEKKQQKSSTWRLELKI